MSSDCPLMGISYQDHGEEGFSTARSFALVEAVSRCPEEDDPEALRNHAKGSGFETVPSVDYSSPIFFVFGHPYFPGALQAWGISMSMRPWGKWNR